MKPHANNTSNPQKEPLDLKGTFASNQFRKFSVLIGILLVGALSEQYLGNCVTLAIVPGFREVNSMAGVFLVICSLVGAFGFFIFLRNVSFRSVPRTSSGRSIDKLLRSARKVGVILLLIALTGFLVGFTTTFDELLRLKDDLTDLALLTGLEIAEAWLWQRGRSCFRGEISS
jgi:hypothetical protein